MTTVDEGANRPHAPILLVTKLHPPTVPAQIVAREALFARRRAGRGRRLSVVACPAGFGSPRCWRRGARASSPPGRSPGSRSTRATTTPSSSGRTWFEALCRACPALDRETLSSLVAAAPLLEVALPRLVSALAEQPEVALVVGDFHRLTAHSTRESASRSWGSSWSPSTRSHRRERNG